MALALSSIVLQKKQKTCFQSFSQLREHHMLKIIPAMSERWYAIHGNMFLILFMLWKFLRCFFFDLC